MKFLKIENNTGSYSLDGNTWTSIEKINKEDLLQLVNFALSDGYEMDVFSENDLGNPAHKIIYKNIYAKLQSLQNNKNRFQDQSEDLYKEALEKYSQ